ncbi:MAG: hypothetical protein LZF86_100032 [Nitrospira sp.]|nr:MAG: hypothetical protein LZF86_100032 [Nitrospira sp.]
MLTGMDQAKPEAASPFLRGIQCVDDRRNFHEVGSRSGDEIYALYHMVWFIPVLLMLRFM